MSSSSLRRLGACLALGLAVAGAGACAGPDPSTHPIKTVADFDDYPCALMTEDELKGALRPPYLELLGVAPTLAKDPTPTTAGDTHACVYTFEPGPQGHEKIDDLTVTVAHQRSGSQPFAICVAGAGTKTPGYNWRRSATRPASTRVQPVDEDRRGVLPRRAGAPARVPEPGRAEPGPFADDPGGGEGGRRPAAEDLNR